MAKRRTVLTFHLWLNMAMKDVFSSRLSAKKIVKFGKS